MKPICDSLLSHSLGPLAPIFPRPIATSIARKLLSRAPVGADRSRSQTGALRDPGRGFLPDANRASRHDPCCFQPRGSTPSSTTQVPHSSQRGHHCELSAMQHIARTPGSPTGTAGSPSDSLHCASVPLPALRPPVYSFPRATHHRSPTRLSKGPRPVPRIILRILFSRPPRGSSWRHGESLNQGLWHQEPHTRA